MFKATKITGQTLVRSLTKLLDKYGLRKKIIHVVKDERSNLNAMIVALKAIVNCEFGLEESFLGTCLHDFSKACQYGIIEKKVCKDLKCVLLSLLKQIYKSASLGLRNLEKECKNGQGLC